MLKNILVLISLVILITGCTSAQETQKVTEKDYLLDTEITINIEGKDAEKACSKIFNRIKEIEDKMNLHDNSSEIVNLNNNSGKKKVKVSKDTYRVLKSSLETARTTGGAFDPTIGPLAKLWEIGTGKEKLPQSQHIKKAVNLVDYNKLQLLQKDNTYYARLVEKGQSVDLGAVAKGYAGDEAKKILKNYDIDRGIINLGGNIVTAGRKKYRSLWRIGIQNPLQSKGNYIGIVNVEERSVVTSGSYERFFIMNGNKYHHIIDPETGYPADNCLLSVTVIAGKNTKADALSTGAFIMGLEKGYKLIESMNDTDAVFITRNKNVYITEGIDSCFKLVGDDFSHEKI